MARAMVTRFGMSDELGPLAYAENQEEVFLGHRCRAAQNVSEATAQKIDQEIRRIIDNCYRRAQRYPQTSAWPIFIRWRKGLLEYETLTGDEIVALLKGIPPVRTPYEEPEPQRGPGPSVPQAGRPRGIGPIAPEPQPGR